MQVNGGPPFVGSVAHTSVAAFGSQKTYWFCVGSHVAWHWTETYWFVVVSRLPQQSWLGHSASLSH